MLFITLVPMTVLTPITWQFLMALKNELQYLKAQRMSFHVICYTASFDELANSLELLDTCSFVVVCSASCELIYMEYKRACI